MAKNKYSRKHRKWLRPTNSWGPKSSVHTEVVAHYYGEDSGQIDAQWGIRDCSEYVSIDVYCESSEQLDKHMKALDNLVDSLNTIMKELEEARHFLIDKGAW